MSQSPSTATLAIGPLTDRKSRKAAIAALIGTAIEYYEFGVYGYLAAIISPLFFPEQERGIALISTLAVFGVSFVVRPIGGIVLGRLGDLVGRKAVLLTTVIGMGIATAITGLLPTHAQIGIWAPIFLLLVRMAQGFFAGGEVTGAATYVAESAPVGRRGFFGGFTPMGVAFGGTAAATAVGLTTAILGDDNMNSWGWRIPFLLSIPLVILSIAIRSTLAEAHEFEKLKKKDQLPKAPLKTVLTQHPGAVIRVILVSFGQNAGYWVGFVFMNIYMTQYLDVPRTTVYWTMACISFVMAFLMPLAGAASDRFGRKRVLAVGFGGYAVLVIPMMLLMGAGSVPLVIAGMFMLALPMPIVQAVGYPTYTEQFPTTVRYTGMSLAFNMGTILGGGITPLIATSLIESTGNLLVPAFILVFAAVVALVTVTRLRETSATELEHR